LSTDDPRPRRIGRLVLALASLALAGSTAFLTWWTTTLSGLPDVGDPFDIKAYARPIPDDSNAFVLYKKATELLPKEPEEPANYEWKTASPGQRSWYERSQEALAIWRKGTDRPDALHINPAILTFDSKFDVLQKLRSFGRLALLHGSRLEDQGDFEAALDWYLALLRSTRHCGKRGAFIDRLFGIAMHRWVSTRLIRWAADPKVDAKMLRKALDAAILAGAATPPTSDSLKTEYLSLLHSTSDPEMMVRFHDLQAVKPGPGGQSGPVLASEGLRTSLIRLQRRALSEPERSRRVLRLIYANWLAYCDLPPSRQPPKIVTPPGQTLSGPASAILGELFVAGDDAPESARALPPEKLARWIGSTMDARMALPALVAFDKAIGRERSAQDTMLFTLANELYEREHGQYPEHVEDLVGPYLKVLPEGYREKK
jgi:tetratricopeptide (TPR) repeat protein